MNLARQADHPDPAPGAAFQSRLDRYFVLTARGTTPTREVLAGATTFLTMAYIVLVNPAILGQAGLPVAAVAAATCFAAAFASILMGLYANVPLALAPGMGLNAYFSFTVVQQRGVPWPVALGCVFISGVVFLLTMFVAPYAQLVPLAATAPALIIVGGLMLLPLGEIAWDDPFCAIPAFLTVAMIPLTFSIANGLAFGIVAHAVLKGVRGGLTRGDWLLVVLAALFVVRFVWLSSGG